MVWNWTVLPAKATDNSKTIWFKRWCRSEHFLMNFAKKIIKTYTFFTECIRSNLQVAQNGRFVINPVHPGGGTMDSKLWYFRLFKSLKNARSRTFQSPKLSLGSWISHFICENFPEYPPDIIIPASIIVYLIQQHFSWFKNYNLHWFWNSSASFFLYNTDLHFTNKHLHKYNLKE